MTFLKTRFPAAKIHTVFSSDLSGRVMDCKVALGLHGKDAVFVFSNELIFVKFQSRQFKIPAGQFSLNRLEKLTGFRLGVKTHKPPAGYVDWLSLKLNY